MGLAVVPGDGRETSFLVDGAWPCGHVRIPIRRRGPPRSHSPQASYAAGVEGDEEDKAELVASHRPLIPALAAAISRQRV